LAKLQFQRAMLYMKDLRHDGKEYERNCRLGRKEDVRRVIQKYGPDFASMETSLTGLMMALYHGQGEVADLLLQMEATINKQTTKGLMALDYLLQAYYKTTVYRQPLLANEKTLTKYWNIIKSAAIVIRVSNRRLTIGSHSMAFFLLVCMRCIEQELREKITVKFQEITRPNVVIGIFTMDDVMKYVECIPDDILPVYRKQRAYVNSVLASHEVDKDNPYNKMLFKRIRRGCYVVNPTIVYEEVN
jgi:hypothetical protein